MIRTDAKSETLRIDLNYTKHDSTRVLPGPV